MEEGLKRKVKRRKRKECSTHPQLWTMRFLKMVFLRIRLKEVLTSNQAFSPQ